MQIKIEIEVKPEELRRFLGLPDVAGLQEELIAFLREKVGSAGDFDPAAFVKGNLDTLRKSQAWQRLLSAAKARAEAGREPAGKGEPPPKSSRTQAASKSSSSSRRTRVSKSTGKPSKSGG